LAVRQNGQKTFADPIKEFEANYTRWSPTTWKGNRYRLNELLAQWGAIACNAITQIDIDRFLAEKQQTITPASRNRLPSTIRVIFETAVNWNFINHNPAREIPTLPSSVKVPEPLTDEALEQLFANLPEYAKLMVTILEYSGIRISELHRITWKDIDFKPNELTIRTSKKSDFRVLPMHVVVSSIFKRLRDGRSWSKSQSGHSRRSIEWPDDSNRSAIVIPVINIRKSLHSACKKAGIRHVHPHMLRHTFATKIRDSGVPLDRLKEFLGHKTMAMVFRYAKVRPKQLQDAIKKI